MIVFASKDYNFKDCGKAEISSYRELFDDKFREYIYFSFENAFWGSRWPDLSRISLSDYNLEIIGENLYIFDDSLFYLDVNKGMRLIFEFSSNACLDIYFTIKNKSSSVPILKDDRRYHLKELIMGNRIGEKFIDYMFFKTSCGKINSDSVEYGMIVEYLSRNDL